MKMEIIITSSSLDPKQNVSGISSVTQFILLKNKNDDPYRSKSLLDRVGLNDRLVNNIQEIKKISLSVIYSQIENMETFIAQSKKKLIDFI